MLMSSRVLIAVVLVTFILVSIITIFVLSLGLGLALAIQWFLTFWVLGFYVGFGVLHVFMSSSMSFCSSITVHPYGH